MTTRTLLLVNKFYHDIGPAGGVGRYLVQEEEDLRQAGWSVIPFAMADEHARPSPWDRYFVRARDYRRAHYGPGTLSDALSLIWNREAAAKLDAMLTETRPDIAHLHNIYHHLSPSILAVLRRHRIPVVMTLHDLRLLCPAIHMLRDGEICERCRGRRLHQAVLGKCVKDSRGASLLAAVETAHQSWRGLYRRTVSTFLCPSRFIRDKYIEWGYAPESMVHLPNFVDLDRWHPRHLDPAVPRDSYLYFGRLSHEKGLRTLLDAQALWEEGHTAGTIDTPPLLLRIAGSGPCEGNLRAYIALRKLKTVEVLGALENSALRGALNRARFTVLPSECYENSPMAALESLAMGIPVVGTDLGGLPEMIQDGVTGVIVPDRDAGALLQGLQRAQELVGADQAARLWAENHAARPDHMVRLMDLMEARINA